MIIRKITKVMKKQVIKKKEALVRFGIWITPTQKKQVVKMAKANNMSQSELIRNILISVF